MDDSRRNNERDAKNGKKKFITHSEKKDTPIHDCDVPWLEFGERCNLLEYRKKLSQYCLRTLGDIARLLENEKYYEPEDIGPDVYDLRTTRMKCSSCCVGKHAKIEPRKLH